MPWWVFIAAGLFSSLESGGYSLVAMGGLLIATASLVKEHRLSGARVAVAVALGSVVVIPRLRVRVQLLWHMSLVALRHVGSCQIRDHL